VYVSPLGQIVGATIAGQYNAFGDLDTLRKVLFSDIHCDIQYKHIHAQIFVHVLSAQFTSNKYISKKNFAFGAYNFLLLFYEISNMKMK
jgi:hypothetical protein